MDLNLLPVFIAIYDAGSVSAAAERLNLSQPGLSTALRRLRIALDDPLFVRTGHGLRPTTRAHALVEPIRAVLNTVSGEVLQRPSYDPAQETGEFRIALTDVGESAFLPRLVPYLARLAPRAIVRNVSRPAPIVARDLEAGAIDLAFGDFSDLRAASFMRQTIGRYSFTCIVRRDHPFVGDTMSLEAFCAWPQVVVEFSTPGYRLLEAFFTRNRIERTVALRNAHLMTLPLLLLESDMMAVVPDRLAEQLVRLGLTRRLEAPFRMPSSESFILWHSRVQNDRRNKWLRAACAAALKLSAPDGKQAAVF